jgi:hypothetical protein
MAFLVAYPHIIPCGNTRCHCEYPIINLSIFPFQFFAATLRPKNHSFHLTSMTVSRTISFSAQYKSSQSSSMTILLINGTSTYPSRTTSHSTVLPLLMSSFAYAQASAVRKRSHKRGNAGTDHFRAIQGTLHQSSLFHSHSPHDLGLPFASLNHHSDNASHSLSRDRLNARLHHATSSSSN